MIRPTDQDFLEFRFAISVFVYFQWDFWLSQPLRYARYASRPIDMAEHPVNNPWIRGELPPLFSSSEKVGWLWAFPKIVVKPPKWMVYNL